MSPHRDPSCRAVEHRISPWPWPASQTPSGSNSWERRKQGRRSDAGGLIHLFVVKRSEETLRQLCAGSGAGSVLTPSAPLLKGLCSPRSPDTPGQSRPPPAPAQGGDAEFAPRQSPIAELPAAGQRLKHTHGKYPDRALCACDTQRGRDGQTGTPGLSTPRSQPR